MSSLDTVLSDAVEHVALSPDGCTLEQLWAALGDAATEAGVQLEAPAVRTALWRLLAAEPGIRATLPGGLRVSARGAAAAEHGEILASAAAAEAAGVCLAAAIDLQDAAVGLHDCQLTRFSVSDTQRRALALIGASRRKGALQNDLATTLGVENRNFFYVIKVLEQRGLVVKHPLVVKRHTGRSAKASFVTTNILHLTRFAPPGITKKARLTDGTAQSHGGSGLGLGGDQGMAALGEEELMVLDDESHFQRICGQLEKCAGQQANESELKVVLGFRGVRGHRLWRRLRPALIKRGHIEEFLAHTAKDGKPVNCIKLIKPWKDEDSDEDEDEDDDGDVDGGAVCGRQVAEASIDRQLLRELVAAGPDGMMVHEVGAALKLNMKRNEPRLRELEARFGARRATVNQGRMITTRFTAPEALLQRFQHLVQSLQPAGGWLAAVAEAIEAGLDEGEPFPWPPQQAAQASLATAAADAQQVQQQQAQETPAQPLLAIAEGAATLPAAPAAPASEVAAAAAAPGAAPLSLDTPVPQPQLPAVPTVALTEGGVVPLPPAASTPAALPLANLTQKKVFTEISQRRLEWVLARIQACGFVLASELPRYLGEREQAETGRKCTMPDRKTCDRVVDRGLAAGALQVLTINFPATFGGLSNRTHTVLAAPGTQPDEAFVGAVYEHYQSFKRRVHGRGAVSRRAAREVMDGKELPVIDLKPLLPGRKPSNKPRRRRRRSYLDDDDEEDMEEWEVEDDAGVGEEQGGGGEGAGADAEPEAQFPQFVMPTRIDTLKTMQANGFQVFRMHRLRLVHEVMCQLAGVGRPAGAPPPPAPHEAQAAASAGTVFLCTALPAADGAHASRIDMQQADVGQDAELASRVLSAKSVWQALTVPQFLHAIGSPSTDHEAVSQLAATNRTLGQLSQDELLVLAGGGAEVARAHTRLVQLLDLAYRMGALSLVLPMRSAGNQSYVSSTADSLFVVRTELFLQEPTERPQLARAPRGAPADQAQQQPQQAQQVGQQAGQARRTHRFRLDLDHSAFAHYWRRMQYVVAQHAQLRGVSTARQPLGRCFPFDRAPEASIDRAWAFRKEVSQAQMELLHAHLGNEDARAMSYERCQEVAAALAMPFEAVITFAREHVQPSQRLGRLAMARLHPMDPAVEDALMRKRDSNRRYYMRKRMRELRERYPEGIPEELLQSRAMRGAEALLRGAGGEGRGAKRKARRPEQSALLPVGGEEASEEERAEEEVQVDQSALLPRPLPVQRKKRWWKAEDRQLLTAWTGWMAVKGRRPILWRVTPGRPSNLKHFTLKRRLAQLEKNEQLAPALAEIRVTALRLHSLLTGREARLAAAREAAEHEATAAKAAAAQQGAPTPAAAAAAAAAVLLGAKRKAAAPADTLKAKKARMAEVAAAVAAAQHRAEEVLAEAGADVAAAGVAASRTMLEALLPPDVRLEVQQGPEGPFPDAVDAVDQLAKLVEHVVATAPKQHKERAHGPHGGPVGRRRPGPKPLSSLQHQQLRAAGGTQVAARPQSLLRRWAAALHSVAAGDGGEGGAGAGAAHPSPGITAALAMAQSLLYMGADSGILGVGYETALSGRFSAQEILRAFELLRRQGALLPVSKHSQQRNFRLTDRWRATLQPSGFAPGLFDEAATTANELSQQRRLDFAGQDGDENEREEGGLAALQVPQRRRRGRHDVSGGAVAALLGGMAAGQVTLRTHHVRAEPQLTAEEEIAAEGGSLQEYKAPLRVEVPVRATLAAPRQAVLAAGGSEGSAAGGEGGGGGAATAGTAAAALAAAAAERAAEGAAEGADEAVAEASGAGEAECEAAGPVESGGSGQGGGGDAPAEARSDLKYTHQELVLFQPSMVACSADARIAAEAACRQALAAYGVADAACNAALAALRAAGTEGATRRQLGAAVQEAGAVGSAAVGHVLEQLLLHGLARSVCGFHGRRFAAAEHSQVLLAFPFMPLPESAPTTTQPQQQPAGHAEEAQRTERWQQSFRRELEQLAGQMGLPPSGQLQPCMDVPVRPWVDHHGRLNARLWQALVRKALAAVAKHPGIPEELLVEELSVVAPQHALELLRTLVAGRALKVQTVRAATPADRVRSAGSVLAACFGAGPAHSVEREQQAQAGSDGAGSGDDEEQAEEVGGGSGSDEGAGHPAGGLRLQRFYSALPAAAFGASARLLPPAVLLPAPGPVVEVDAEDA